ncbi:hypothetical protein J437_LFUL001684 [Ladona fulva]|uniref:Transmembrane protein 188 n=1 Tax=Ladona fulva TaxID=123851 RepID=A0A8K0K2J0_LADFU|nr:hypothetical protein J437_LFUL001684 [Ladona fulva]
MTVERNIDTLDKITDLKAFERRLTEVIACLQPATIRWRILLAVVSICTAAGAWHWLSDPQTSAVSFTQSLWNHPFFTLASIILASADEVQGLHRGKADSVFRAPFIGKLNQRSADLRLFASLQILTREIRRSEVILFVMGIHKRVIAPSIITARTRLVLAEFNMSCDDTGKLLLKPRPTANT